MDPTVAQLAAMVTLDDACTFARVQDPLRAALFGHLGAPSAMEDLAGISPREFEDCVAALQVSGGPATPVAKSRARQLYRACRLKSGLAAEAPPFPPPPAVGPGPSVAVSPAVERSIKLSALVDPHLDATLRAFEPQKVRDLFARYKAARGEFPHVDHEPSEEQLAAVAQQLQSGVAPYVDFSIFGPHGRRMQRKMSYISQQYNPSDGSWKKAELPGPPSFEQWWRAWLVLRCTLLLLEEVRAEPLELYGEHVHTLSVQYGPQCWFIIYQADIRMRSEEFERIRRRGELARASLDPAQQPAHPLDPVKPWSFVFLQATQETEFWDLNVRHQCLLYLARVRTAAEITDDGTVQPGRALYSKPLLDARWPDAKRRRGGQGPRPSGGAPRGPSAPPPPSAASPQRAASKKKGKNQKKGGQAPKGPAKTGGGSETCNNWNAGHCVDGPCPHHRRHVCDRCGGMHRRTKCTR